MGCQATQSFLVKNRNNSDLKKIAGIIFGAPFFDFHPMSGTTVGKKIFLNILCRSDLSNNLIFNTGLPIHWVCSDKVYFDKILALDGCANPFASPGVILGMENAMTDIRNNPKAHDLPFCMLLAGKDKLVDNAASRQFYSKCGTPSDRKSIKLFPNAYHEIHKEGKFKAEMYETIYKFVIKTLSQGKYSNENKTLAFGGLKTFQVGRPANAKKFPYFKHCLLFAGIFYLIIGLLI